MPNHCQNLLTIHPPPGTNPLDILTVINALRGPNGPVDFTCILPIPAPLQDIQRGGQRIGGAYHSHWREETAPDGSVRHIPIPASELARYRREYGADCPLDWCIRRWGCKWNAECYDSDWDGNAIRFDTPWSPPTGFVQALSNRFPDIQFELRFIEPGVCLNGRVVYQDGEECQSETCAMDSDAGRENAVRIGAALPEVEEELVEIGV